MKRLLYLCCIGLVMLTGINCQKELSYDLSGPSAPGSKPVNATVQGNIIDENGNPANGVLIKAGTKTTTTDAHGYFRITNASLDQQASVVTAEKNGYFKTYRTFQANAGANHIQIQLLKRTTSGSINTATGGDITLANGTRISFPASAVVKTNGTSYAGTMNVYAAYIDPTATNISSVIPGSLMADDKEGKRVVLSSYGMLAVELETSGGEKLQIATGKSATLSMTIPASLQASAPASIPLWYVDEQTGLWKEEGSATLSAGKYTGDVKHFTFWNCDIANNAINLSMTLKTANNSLLVHSLVQVEDISSGARAWGFTDSTGKVSGLVPSNKALRLDVLDECYQSVYSQNIGPYSQNTNLGTITVPATATGILTIQGQLINCSGSPVTSGFVIFSTNNLTRYISVSNTGAYSFSMTNCSGATSATLIGVDKVAGQQGPMISSTLSSPLTTINPIAACGTSIAEFMNYTVDGVNYSIDPSLVTDSASAVVYNVSPNYSVWVSCRNATYTKNVTLLFATSAMVPGTYTATSLYANSLQGGTVIQPSTVTLTKYAVNVGEFFEGSFSGSFIDAIAGGPAKAVTGTFRVRRYQ